MNIVKLVFLSHECVWNFLWMSQHYKIKLKNILEISMLQWKSVTIWKQDNFRSSFVFNTDGPFSDAARQVSFMADRWWGGCSRLPGSTLLECLSVDHAGSQVQKKVGSMVLLHQENLTVATSRSYRRIVMHPDDSSHLHWTHQLLRKGGRHCTT